MKIKVSEAAGTRKFRTTRGMTALDFKIADSILKTHFKALMKLARCYDKKEKTGLITEGDKTAFLALVEQIEKSDSEKARASHAKTVEKAKVRRETRNSGCDHNDLGSLGYAHGTTVRCPHCGDMAEVW